MMTISKNSKVTGSSYFREVAMKYKSICLRVTCPVIGHPLYAQEPNPEFIVDCW